MSRSSTLTFQVTRYLPCFFARFIWIQSVVLLLGLGWTLSYKSGLGRRWRLWKMPRDLNQSTDCTDSCGFLTETLGYKCLKIKNIWSEGVPLRVTGRSFLTQLNKGLQQVMLWIHYELLSCSNNGSLLSPVQIDDDTHFNEAGVFCSSNIILKLKLCKKKRMERVGGRQRERGRETGRLQIRRQSISAVLLFILFKLFFLH